MNYYEKLEQESIEELKELLARPMAPKRDYIGSIDPKTNKPEYFDPWGIFPSLYGNYSSEFDDMAIETLQHILDGNRREETLAHEMFREMLCRKNLCDYGTSPRVCFPTSDFRELLPEYIAKWKEYYKLNWSSDYDEEQSND